MNEITKTGSSALNFTHCYASDDTYDTYEMGLLNQNWTMIDRGAIPMHIQLLGNDGNPIGNANYGYYGSYPLTTDGVITVGNNRDKWGAILTSEIINSANFGLQAKLGVWFSYYHNDDPDNPIYQEVHDTDFRNISNFGFDIPTNMKIFGIKTNWEGHYTYWTVEGWGEMVKNWTDYITMTVYYDKRRSIYTIF